MINQYMAAADLIKQNQAQMNNILYIIILYALQLYPVHALSIMSL